MNSLGLAAPVQAATLMRATGEPVLFPLVQLQPHHLHELTLVLS